MNRRSAASFAQIPSPRRQPLRRLTRTRRPLIPATTGQRRNQNSRTETDPESQQKQQKHGRKKQDCDVKGNRHGFRSHTE